MKKVAEKLHHHEAEKDHKESKHESTFKATESTDPIAKSTLSSPSKHHSQPFSGVADKLHNIFHSSGSSKTSTTSTEALSVHTHHTTALTGHEHIHEHVNAPIVETIIKPTVIEETVRRDKVVEIQPIVHRHIEAPEVHHIEQHVYEKIAPQGPARIVKQAVIEETIQPHITEEVRTVLHREVPAPYVVHEEQHITEHLVRPTIHTAEVRQDKAEVVIQQKADVLMTDVHTDDWEHQRVDTCPLAQQEKLGLTQTTTTTTTTKEHLVAPAVTLEKKVTFEENPTSFSAIGGSAR